MSVLVFDLLKLRPDAGQKELVRVYNDTVAKVRMHMLLMEKDMRDLEDRVMELAAQLDELKAATLESEA